MLEFLNSYKMFNKLTIEHKALLFKLLEEASYQKDEVIIKEGDDDKSLFLIYSGSARIVKKNDYGEEVDIAFLDGGTYFGELSLLDNQPRSASIVAFEDCVCFKLSPISYSLFCRQFPEAQVLMLRGFLLDVVSRIRNTNEDYLKYN
ncbi:MAG: cyclic nucleotide-binding domain-containing protein [Spirochaetota bacterium]|nr:cyclic nucleotide-binding domain-containing protein [Spirochaetota bacterium]